MHLSMAELQSTQLTNGDTIPHREAEGVGEITLGTIENETIVGHISGKRHCWAVKETIKILSKFWSIQIAAETGNGAIIKTFLVAGASPYVCAEYRGGKG